MLVVAQIIADCHLHDGPMLADLVRGCEGGNLLDDRDLRRRHGRINSMDRRGFVLATQSLVATD